LILLDAYALIALLRDEPAADEVEGLLRGGDCAVSVVNLAESIDVSCRVHHLALEDVRNALTPLILAGQVRPLVPDERSAWKAAELRNAYYQRKSCELSLADCFLLSAALPGDKIATADAPAARVARLEEIEVIALPDSEGARP
jgi:PIN domain nuclease of toxin-antitoxin system